MDATTNTTVARLRGLLEVTRLVRTQADQDGLLDAIAHTVAESLGFEGVVVNVYRPAWDDFAVATAHGVEEARELLEGETYPWSTWERALDPRFELRPGAYLIPHSEADPFGEDVTWYVPDLEVSDDPDAWHPEDALLVPMVHSDGHLLGILSVDEPRSGRRPSDDELDVLVAVAAHAALVVEGAQEEVRRARHRRGLEQLLEVSARLTEATAVDDLLQAICDGITTALGFGVSAVDLVDEAGGLLLARAAAGCDAGEDDRVPLPALQRLLDPDFEREGCFLLPLQEALDRVGPLPLPFVSRMNGRGPHAWQRHWLLVPLHDRTGDLVGVIWADEPEDRLLPTRERLQALRAFGNQAAAALDAAAQFERIRFLADHDPLTGLANRRRLADQLAAELSRGARYGRPLTLVLCDLDGFKAVNDAHGHLAGDDALRYAATALVGALRADDGAFRMGGDEFALLLVEAGRDEAREVVERVVAALAAIDDPRFGGLRASFGTAVFPGDGRGPEDLLRAADDAMYAARGRRGPPGAGPARR